MTETEESILSTSVEADYEGDSDIAEDESVMSAEADEEEDLEDFTEDAASDQPHNITFLDSVQKSGGEELRRRWQALKLHLNFVPTEH